MKLLAALVSTALTLLAQGVITFLPTHPSTATYPTPTHTWLIDEGSGSTVNDSETAANDGTFPGTSADPTWAGGGLTFASGDYVPMASLTSMAVETAANTVCTTFKLASTGANASAIGEYGGATAQGWWLGGSVNSSHKAEWFTRGSTGGTGNGMRIQFGGTPSTTPWYHVCVAMPANPTCATTQVYIDGVESSSGSNCPQDNLSANPTYSGNSLRLGTQVTTGVANGQIVGVTHIWEGDQLDSSEIGAVCDADATTMALRSITINCP